MKTIDYTAANPAWIDENFVTVESPRVRNLGLTAIDFDKDRGFVWSGRGCCFLSSRFGAATFMLDENRRFCRVFGGTIEKDKKPDIGDGNDRYAQIKISEYENGCLQDLQPLFEDYFWDYFSATFGEKKLFNRSRSLR